MRLLLINKNPVVSRMMQMSVPKAGFDIEECDSIYDLPTGMYEVVVIDDEMYDENFLHDIKQNIKYRQIGIITTSKNADFSNFDFVLTKPFLPTDLIEILRKVKSEIEQQEEILPMSEPEEPKEELFENFLKGESAPFEEEEKIVEVEEPQEESPFVEEPLEKAGVLKEDEVEKVSELLKEPELQEPLAVTQEEPSEQKEDIESFFATSNEEESMAKSFEEPLVETLSVQEEEQPEEPQSTQEEPARVSAPQALGAITPEDLLTDVQEEIVEEKIVEEEVQAPQETSLQDLKNELQKLDVKGLREILDGMQLEITIKISYPDRKDV
jgi:hypothetical protein